ncbi:MAG: hypothetical protein MI755_16265 [Sphingomonadales bacterium]|nr:hypothetical protein [Sphingomonadales bacterium]
MSFWFARPHAVVSVAASQAATGFPDDNLVHDQIGVIWKSNNLTAVTIDVEFAAVTEVDVVGVVANNGTAAGTFDLRGAATQGGLAGAGVIASANLRASPSLAKTGYRKGLIDLAAPVSHTWYRVSLTDAANPDGFFRFGRLVLAKAWRPSRNPGIPREWGVQDNTILHVTDGHAIVPEARGRHTVMRLPVDFLTEEEREVMIEDLLMEHGADAQLLVRRPSNAAAYLENQLYFGSLKATRLPRLANRAAHFSVRLELTAQI